MKSKKAFPIIISSLLFALLLTMVQFAKVQTPILVHAQEQARPDYFYLPVGAQDVSTVTEADYREVIGKVLAQNFNPVFQQTGRPLLIPLEWINPYFGAFAQDKGAYMQISMWGGVARAPGASKVVLSTILCHELGHILGGEPRQTIPGADWASAEGQSDFFAATTCLPNLFRAYPDLAPSVSAEVEQVCAGNVDCGRVLQAGLETVRFFQKYSYRSYEPVSVHVSAKNTETLVRNSYPSDQCRLDSFVSGARCQLGRVCRAPGCWLPDDKVEPQ